jgi:hypothetical protein
MRLATRLALLAIPAAFTNSPRGGKGFSQPLPRASRTALGGFRRAR